MIPLLLVYGAVMFANRVKNWQRGRPDNRRTTLKNAKKRAGDFRAGVYMQTLLREPGAGIMHSMIYFGFLILLAVTTVLEVNHQLPESAKFLHGDVYRAYRLRGRPPPASSSSSASCGAIVRRYGPWNWRPYRIRIKSKPEHMVILGVFFAIAVTGFGAEMFRIAEPGPCRRRAAGLREVEFHRLPARRPRRRLGQRRRLASGLVDRPRRQLHGVPRDPADHDAAPHVHLAAEHVPEGQGPAGRAR